MSQRRTLTDRIRAEFTEWPGLKITKAQACRLWHSDESACDAALAALIEEGFLRRTASGAFIALPRPGGRRAKADLSSGTSRTVRCPHCHHLNSLEPERGSTDRTPSATFRCVACAQVVTLSRLSA